MSEWYLLHFDDAEKPVEVYTEANAALAAYAAAKANWTCTLFVNYAECARLREVPKCGRCDGSDAQCVLARLREENTQLKAEKETLEEQLATARELVEAALEAPK